MSDDDNDRLKFIERLARADISFTVWEAEFIDKVSEWEEPLTDAMRNKIDQLRKRYGREL